MQNEVEVIEKKGKKPLSKKRIVAIVAIALAALLLTPVVNQCVIMAFSGTLYSSASLLQNTHVYAENIYIEGGVLHYTIVNDTIKELRVRGEGGRGIQKLVEGKWVDYKLSGAHLSGAQLLGDRHQQLHSPLPPTVPAFSELERICSFEEAIFEFTEGDYRLLDSAQPCRYSRITEFWDSVSPVPIIRRSPLGYSVPVYFSIPAAS